MVTASGSWLPPPTKLRAKAAPAAFSVSGDGGAHDPVAGDDDEDMIQCDGVSSAQLGRQQEQLVRLCIKNLSKDITLDHMRQMFDDFLQQWGTSVRSSTVRNKKSGVSRGIGFIIIEEGYVSRVFSAFDGLEIGGQQIVIEVSERQSRVDRFSELQGPQGNQASPDSEEFLRKSRLVNLEEQHLNMIRTRDQYRVELHEAQQRQIDALLCVEELGQRLAQQDRLVEEHHARLVQRTYAVKGVQDSYGGGHWQGQPCENSLVHSAVSPEFLRPPGQFALNGGREAGAAGPAESVRYVGVLKSASAKRGYSFISCDETLRIYGRDVYVPRSGLPSGSQVGDHFVFTTRLDNKNRPAVACCDRLVTQ